MDPQPSTDKPEVPRDESETVSLLKRHREGDSGAATQLFQRYLPRVREIAHARLGNANPLRDLMDSQDVLQDALLKAYRGLNQLEVTHPGQFIVWMAKIVENTVRDAGRAAGALKRGAAKRLKEESAEAAMLAAIDTQGPTPSQMAMGQELAQRYFAALEKLPEDLREVILLRRHADFSYEAIAHQLHLGGEAQARMLLSRALSALAKLMDQA